MTNGGNGEAPPMTNGENGFQAKVEAPARLGRGRLTAKTFLPKYELRTRSNDFSDFPLTPAQAMLILQSRVCK